MEILSSAEQQILIKNSNLSELVSNDYLEDSKNDNLILIANLFFNDDLDRAKSFNVWSNLFWTISDWFKFFVWSPKCDIDFNLSRYTEDYMTIWRAVFWIWVKDWEYVTEYIPAKWYMHSNWEHKVFKYYQWIVEDETKYFLLRQIYTPWNITNELFQLDSLESIEWDKVPMETIPQTTWMEENISTWLEDVSLYVVEDTQSLEWKKQSIIDKITWIVYSLDRKAVLFETQFMQEVEQYKIFENIAIPDYAINTDWTVDLKAVWKVLATDSSLWASWDVKFISNANALVKDAIEYEKTQLKKISSAVFIPLDFLWLETTWTTSWSSRTIMISSFVKSVESKRKDFEEQALLPILKLLEEKNAKNKDWDKVTSLLFWDKPLPASWSDLANEYKTSVEAWLISQYSAIKLYNWLNTESEMEQELENFNIKIWTEELEWEWEPVKVEVVNNETK